MSKDKSSGSKFNSFWKDAVFSKLIAEVIKGLWIVWLLPIALAINASIKSFFAEINFRTAWKETITATIDLVDKTINLNITTVILSIMAYILITCLIRKLISSRKSSKIKQYNTDRFWNAIIKWKWENENGELKVKYADYDMICPNSQHNLVHDQDHYGNYFLRCNQCSFTSAPFHTEAPSNVIILLPMNDHYFHSALTSMIDAELRRMELK